MGKPIRKVKKSHYPDSRFTPDQFWSLAEAIRYPVMYSPCLSMCFRESCTGGFVFFVTPKFWLSFEFCALARPGPSIMNSESVDRQVSSMLDSECLDRLGSSVASIKKSWFFKKMSRFHEKIKISWKRLDFMKKSRFYEKSRFHEQIEISWKVEIWPVRV